MQFSGLGIARHVNRLWKFAVLLFRLDRLVHGRYDLRQVWPLEYAVVVVAIAFGRFGESQDAPWRLRGALK
jgi:hypothetical protein